MLEEGKLETRISQTYFSWMLNSVNVWALLPILTGFSLPVSALVGEDVFATVLLVWDPLEPGGLVALVLPSLLGSLSGFLLALPTDLKTTEKIRMSNRVERKYGMKNRDLNFKTKQSFDRGRFNLQRTVRNVKINIEKTVFCVQEVSRECIFLPFSASPLV